MEAQHLVLNSADFRVYSRSEILQLSVKEITSSQTFDILQNPVMGGLHDPALGPCRRDDRCESCGQSEKNCPGHLGHISLPVLVFNPMFFKTLLQLLRGTCMSCHRINMSNTHVTIYTHQLNLLQRGLLTEAQNLKERFFNSEKPEAEVLDDITAYMKEILQNAEKDEKVLSRNVITQTQDTVRTVLKAFSGAKLTCCHCNTRNRNLKAEYSRTIVGTLVEEKAAKKKIQVKRVKDNGNGDGGGGENENNEMETTPEEEVDMEKEGVETENSEVMKEGEQEDGELQTELEQFLKSKHKRCIISPNIARDHVRLVWKHNHQFLKQLFPFIGTVKGTEVPTDVFFLDVIPVPPSRFRPLSMLKERKYEHPQTANLSNVLKECALLKDLLSTYSKRIEGVLEDNVQGLTVPETSESMTAHMQKIMSSWLRLQSKVNVVLDSDLDKISEDKCNGVKQLLEKKEGLFRMHMMGKRVNFAARSVISPDPYISTNEIGIPIVFASKLTYPQRVTPWNVQELRQMVINGPAKYPGASSVVNEDGSVVKLNPTNLNQREAIAKQLLVLDKKMGGSKMVCRHLINGDYLLLNRQPTLHRPSIQAHKARVLPDIKTLRMHYSNCKAYNADFDGDEMNAHFPQCELSRAEASVLACTDNQYLVPKDGTPLAGLIQDHMVAGVALTIRGRFFTRQDYCGLVWGAMNDFRDKIVTLPPAILKPQPLWSGKQIVSTILLNIIPKGKAPINLKSKAKIPEKSWLQWIKKCDPSTLPLNMAAMDSEALGESTVIFSEGELLQGVLDKAHYGPSTYGLVHCCYELYGGEVAGRLLTYLGRLFTSFLQMVGFSLGVGDILVKKKADSKRKSFIKKSQHVGQEAVIKAMGMTEGDFNERDLLLELKKAHFDKDGLKMAEIDMCMKGQTDKIQDSIAKSIMPGGLEKGFPDNSLQLMVQSGAKGSPVNSMQISCLLGQIELEGRRPPLMLSGRSLPSFQPYDVSPKAGGFVSGRFLTGIRPQEYFFHCMAGREGLIDTAVKTSRSGYLQRCLVKHLEGLMINYDLTVRDSDGGLIQFYYGEDGLDPCHCPYLKPSQFPFLTENLHAVMASCSDNPWPAAAAERKSVKRTWKKISKWRAHTTEQGHWSNRDSGFLEFCKSDAAPSVTKAERRALVRRGRCQGRSEAVRKSCEAWENMSLEEKESWSKKKSCPEPVMSRYLPHTTPDVMSEKFRHLLNVFCKKGFSKVVAQLSQDLNPESFKVAVNKKVVQSLAQPGEAVGLVCAQSVGEPSTQMTLNTFHFAGRGEMNVTLGIPRLREILMTASAKIKTPSMDVPVRMGTDVRARAEHLQRHLNRITLDRVIQSVHVKISSQRTAEGSMKAFEAKLKFLPRRDYADFTNLTPRAIMTFVVKRLLAIIDNSIKKENIVMGRTTLLSSGRLKRAANTDKEDKGEKEENGATQGNTDKEADNDDVDADPNDGDATAMKEQQRQLDTQEYEGEDEERQEVVQEDNEEAEDNDDNVDGNPGKDGDVAEEGEDENDTDSNKEEMTRREDLSQADKDLLTQALANSFVKDFKFDEKKHRWCVVIFEYKQSQLQLDIRMLMEKAIRNTVIHQVQGISRAFLSEQSEDGEQVLHLKTEGVNIQELFKYPDLLDLNRIYSNCVHTMATTYGVEAANRVIIKEIQNVFGAYGITVDYRHLSLLADYMTCRGHYDAFNRRDISFNTSPLQKMTFETTMNFLLDACISGNPDVLESPSARLVLGKVVGVGTGCMDILDPLK